MTVGILTEKPSAAKKFAKAFGGAKGSFEGTSYAIVSARGHLYEFADPHEMVKDADKATAYKSWNVERLPWDPQDLDWHVVPIKDAGGQISAVKSTLSNCDEIIIATDVDPTGEGGMIAGNILRELGLESKKLTRMYFTDEEPPSLQKAFRERKQVASLSSFDEMRKAQYRSKFDLLSMQFTRVATTMARESGRDLVLRNGRLKSAMVLLVGDQLKAWSDYVKKPFFENRFRDENGVVYTNKEEPRFEKEADVPKTYVASDVVKDSATMKSTAPPRLLDLAGLSVHLQARGVKAADVLKTYQQMYVAGVVSYPRTEDKTITPEQFNELLPKVEEIAAVVGVDVAQLTHRSPRKTHVKPQGAHGANRPGPNVPASLSALEADYGKTGRMIYEILAKNYLTMLAEDYEYEQQKGHVADYEKFVGTANVPKVQGWKAVFNADADDEDQDESSAGLGTRAEPFVHEGANPRPQHPSMKWLIAQLDKHDVGTGATRTNTYAEVTNARSKYPLLVEKGSKLTLAEAGELNWRLLPDTHIGDLELTKRIYANMTEVAGGADPDAFLAEVADLVRDDLKQMQVNAEKMRAELGLSKTAASPRATGVWMKHPQGATEVSFKRIFSGHEFTDDEIAQLLAGEEISFEATSKEGRTYTAVGSLGLGTFKGRSYVGFQLKPRQRADKPTVWAQHSFTPQEVETLLAGGEVEADDFVSKAGKKFSTSVSWDAEAKKIEPAFAKEGTEPPKAWCEHVFTPEERKKLAAGQSVKITDFVSGKARTAADESGDPPKTFTASVEWKTEGGRKKIVPDFGGPKGGSKGGGRKPSTRKPRK